MKLLQTAARIFDFAGEPNAWRYVLGTRSPSIASYRICQAVRALLGEPATVLDVGANQGQFAAAAAWWFPRCRIISFEPVPNVFARLKHNISRFPNVSCECRAVGERAGELEFFESLYSHASSALQVNDLQRQLRPDTAKGQRIIVPVTTLDEFAMDKSWERPLLLKLDVQGYERKVLEGSRRFISQVDYLLFECSYQPLYEGEPLFAEMYSFVTALGFKLLGPVGSLEGRNHVILQSDLLWGRPAK